MTCPRRPPVARRGASCAITLVMAAAGCSQTKPPLLTAPEPPIVWPPAPDQPRVRYLGQLTGSTDVRPEKTFGQVWDEIIHGPPPPSMFVRPYAVAIHDDGVRAAIADPGAGCVHVFDLQAPDYRRIDACGSPPRPLESPVALAWIGDTLWVADSRGHALALLAARPGTRAGPGSIAAAGPASGERWIGADQLKRPSGLAYCPANQLVYVSDAAAHAILAFEQDGGLALQFGSHGSAQGQFNSPAQLACGQDSLFVIDALNARVQQMGLDGTPMAMFGRKGDAAGDLALPKGVAVGPEGNLWIVDAQFENVQAFTPDGRLLMAFGEEGHEPGEFWLPAGATIDARNRLWIADSYNRRVQVFELLP